MPVCWLCMSDPAKDEARDALYKWLDIKVPRTLPYNYESATALLNDIDMGGNITKWRMAESVYKQQRIDGNPRAYFAE